jgi:hypothetical protein
MYSREWSEVSEGHTASILMLASGLTYAPTLKTEAICSAKPLDDVHRTIQCYIPEGRPFQHVLSLREKQINDGAILTNHRSWPR